MAVSVFEGNTADSKTFMPAVQRVRDDFGLQQVVMVGDRGRVSQKALDELRENDGMGWIAALKSVSIRALVEQGQLQLDLFDERHLLELESPDYPGERLMAYRNDALAKLRAHKRQDLLKSSEARLLQVEASVNAVEMSLTASAVMGPVTNGSISSLGMRGIAAPAGAGVFVLRGTNAPANSGHAMPRTQNSRQARPACRW